MIIRVTMLLLCGIGLYASAFMARKAARAARGELTEASVVQTPAARAVGGVPNAAIGLAYYAAFILTLPFLQVPVVWDLTLVASAAAAAFSAYLAYSLLFITRMPCTYCWTGHMTNWTLLILTLLAHPAA